jgi:tRNA (guanine37-N1)-methyltransferase
MTPQGIKYNQGVAFDLSKEKHLIFICGHYEGFDERIRTLADMEISIGDFVLTGGEIPSMAICDSVIRLIDGVIEKESYEEESFQGDLLDYPVYTRPADFRGMKVPEVLLSGHHAKINEWRYNEQLKRTKERRPDLLERVD